MPSTMTIADYLFTRLKQLGIMSVHGVPGDYNLSLLDHVEPIGLSWVGNTNELNAGYAADGYSRIKGVGALITTFGVGELSAINAIAGAYTERAAVIHIVGTPSRACQIKRQIVHHTLGDGDFRHFSRMYAHVTVAQAKLVTPKFVAQQIDEILQQCLIHSRPVYIEVPEDMVNIIIPATHLNVDISVAREVHQPTMNAVCRMIVDKISAAERPIIMVDSGTRPLGLADLVQDLIDLTQWPTFTSISGKGLVNMSAANVYGIYRGNHADLETEKFFNNADLVLCFGPHLSSTNTYNWSAMSKTAVTISWDFCGVTVCSENFADLSSKLLLEALLKSLRVTLCKKYLSLPRLSRDKAMNPCDLPSTEPIKQEHLWRSLASFLQFGDILLGETGTSGYGVRELALPKNVKLFTPITWLSIGYMLPAALGAALAQRELVGTKQYRGKNSTRTILIIGDGSFQMTAQEVATILKHHLNVIIFLINNDGYTIERCIHGRNQSYNDVSSWKYLKAAEFFGGRDAYTARVRTYGELAHTLQDPGLVDGDGFRMVEILLDRDDVPAGPLSGLLQEQMTNEAVT